MDHSPATPEERFALVVEELLGSPGVTPPADGTRSRKMFGVSALKVYDKIFAMLSGGKLVVKLPKSRVDALVAAGEGEHFDPRRDGRLMKEWIVIESTSEEQWLALAREAMHYQIFRMKSTP
jgi:TfoX/Sxy family transcriptional regulator of competence genes